MSFWKQLWSSKETKSGIEQKQQHRDVGFLSCEAWSSVSSFDRLFRMSDGQPIPKLLFDRITSGGQSSCGQMCQFDSPTSAYVLEEKGWTYKTDLKADDENNPCRFQSVQLSEVMAGNPWKWALVGIASFVVVYGILHLMRGRKKEGEAIRASARKKQKSSRKKTRKYRSPSPMSRSGYDSSLSDMEDE
jgi:hypothetical protein